MSSNASASAGRGFSFLDHPQGLYVLFFTEMWERFNFYLMQALFVLYLTGYLGFSDKTASDIQTWYIALVYFSPFFGGLIADRLIGYSRAILIGGFLMAAGSLALAMDRQGTPGHPFLFGALALLICGNGLLKPNISALVGKLYHETDPRRDQGFTIFYMGINIGAFAAPLAASLLRERFGWHAAFAAGGVGMLIGMAIYSLFGRRFAEFRPIPWKPPESGSESEIGETHAQRADRLLRFGQLFNMISLVAAMAGLIFLPFLPWTAWLPALQGLPNWVTPVAVFFAVWMIIEFITIGIYLSARDGQAFRAARLKIIFLVVALFWMAFHQNSVSLTFFARDKHSAELVSQAVWPIRELKTAEQYQAVNPFFVVLFSPLMAMLWSWLQRRGQEPSATTKMGFGMLVTAVAYVIMTASGYSGADTGRVGPYWLVSTYALLTVAELCLSPIGLSLTSRLAPDRYKGLWMGFWFTATAIGNKLVHVIGQYWQREPGVPGTVAPSRLFLALIISSLAAAVLLTVLLKVLDRIERRGKA